ncbi:MAG: protelomerase family protein, partial [Cyanobacteria bacterium J06638_20]
MLAKPTTKVKLTVPCEAINTLVERATHLLGSEEWSDVGAGLAVLVGRRISEIVLSGFTLKTSWSLEFSQMAKKADDVDITLEIPTLAPAQIVLEAIDRLQRKLSSNVNTTGIPLREAKRTVNRRYSGAIANRCEEVFSDLVPRRSDKDNLYTHIFRAVYATIAAHWYCPPNIPEHQFKAEIQGHFSITQEGKKLPNYSARSNYDDYAIG